MPQARYSAILLERRRELGVTLGQAARDLKMKERILQALEDGDFAAIPSNGYAQGMVGSYARYLGLDDSAVIQQFNEDLYVYEHGSNANRRPRSQTRGQDRRAGRERRPRTGASPLVQNGADPYATQQRYPQGRPYTTRAPQQGRQAGQPRGLSQEEQDERFYRSSQRIETRPPARGYTDDMRYGRAESSYEAASSARGRVSSRNIASTQRPYGERHRVQTGRRPRQPQGALSNQNMVIVIGLVVALVLTLIIVLSVGSCVNNAVGTKDTGSTVPVATADTSSEESSSTDSSQSAQTTQSTSSTTSTSQTAATSQTSTTADAGTTATSAEKTEVVVSVAENSVSWVEVTVDGKSMVAESVTGPWTQTYEPTEAMTIQVGDTAAVTVTKNGVTQTFDGKASGLGSMTIKVPKTATQDASTDSATADGTSTDSTASGTASGTASSASSGTTGTSGSTSGTSGTSGSATASGASASSSKTAQATTSQTSKA